MAYDGGNDMFMKHEGLMGYASSLATMRAEHAMNAE